MRDSDHKQSVRGDRIHSVKGIYHPYIRNNGGWSLAAPQPGHQPYSRVYELVHVCEIVGNYERDSPGVFFSNMGWSKICYRETA